MTQTRENLSLKLEPIINHFKSISEKELKSIITKLANFSRRSKKGTFYITDDIYIESEILDIIVNVDLPKTNTMLTKILYLYNPLRYYHYKVKPKAKDSAELWEWINSVVIPDLEYEGYNIEELVNNEYVKDMCKPIDMLAGSILKFGNMKVNNIDVLSATELYFVSNNVYGFDDTVDIHLRWYAFKETIPKDDLLCPFCKRNWLKYTRDKIDFSKYDRLSATCKSEECYGKYRSHFMKSLEVNPSQLEEVKRKKTETFKKHYGVDNIFKRKDIMVESWKRKLGVDNPTKNIDIRYKAITKTLINNGNVEITFRGKRYRLTELEASILRRIEDLKEFNIIPQYVPDKIIYADNRLYFPDIFVERNDLYFYIEVKTFVGEIYDKVNIQKFDSTINLGKDILVIVPEDYKGNLITVVDYRTKTYCSCQKIEKLDERSFKFRYLPKRWLNISFIVKHYHSKLSKREVEKYGVNKDI